MGFSLPEMPQIPWEIPGFGPVEVSIVDAANPLVFVRAETLGLTGRELPDELNADEKKLELLETVRGMAAQKLGLTDDYKKIRMGNSRNSENDICGKSR